MKILRFLIVIMYTDFKQVDVNLIDCSQKINVVLAQTGLAIVNVIANDTLSLKN